MKLIKSAIIIRAWQRLKAETFLTPPALRWSLIYDEIWTTYRALEILKKGEGKLSLIKVKVSAETCQKK